MTMLRQHAVFVYGTLRPGQSNYRQLLAGRTVKESPAIAMGLALFGTRFPYAVPEPGGRIVGDLLTIEPNYYQDVLADLDVLEGYDPQQPENSHYLRATRPVIATRALPAGGTWETFHTAWIYLAGPAVTTATMPRIADDDWLAAGHRR